MNTRRMTIGGAALTALLLVAVAVILLVQGSGARPPSSSCMGAPWQAFDAHVATGGDLNGVAAISSTDAWAVGGYHATPSTNRMDALIEHWDGVRWRIVASPSPGADYSILAGVSAVSASDAWAVGTYETAPKPSDNVYGPPHRQALIEHWNGSTWSVMPAPSVTGSDGTDLLAVSAISARDVWAAGYTEGGASKGGVPLLLHWDGAHWRIAPGANLTAVGSYFALRLYAVAASGPEDVWVAGGSEARDGSSHGQMTVLEHWDGTHWTLTPAPSSSVNSVSSALRLAAVSPAAAWLVGTRYTGAPNHPNSTLHPFIWRWNGAQWADVAPPTPPGSHYTVSGVAIAPETATVWISGVFQATLAARWTGTAWALASNTPKSPMPSSPTGQWSDNNYLPPMGFGGSEALAVTAAGELWLVGVVGRGQGHQAVTDPAIARYQSACAA